MYGVPQGSILGPLLFVCYLTGLPSISEENSFDMVLYADDANLVFSGKNPHEIEYRAGLEMLKIKQFLNSAHLLLNTNKTNFISFHTKQNRNPLNPIITIEDYSVEQLTDTKFLGLIIDCNLSWDEHVKFLTKKLSSGLYALRRMKHYCNLTTLKTIYFSLLQSHISYGIAIYGGTTKKNLDYILKLQKKAIRIILNLSNNESVKKYFKELKFLTVYDLYILETVKYCKHNHVLNSQSQTHTYNTRNHFISERHNIELYKKKTTFAGLRFLQCLPQDIRIEHNLSQFTSKLKSFLLNISCYSFEEFYELTVS
uniref:Reverse transcriptase domain-containing protein n=1 Tax=Cuerna arida TaxID=1464854 RepID=A0A1B6FRU9_9HEMI